MKLLADIWQCCRLAFRYRHLRVGRVSNHAQVAMEAAEIVEDLRRMYYGREFVWSPVTNTTLDSSADYIVLWEVSRDRAEAMLRFQFKGQIRHLRQYIAKGALGAPVPPPPVEPIDYRMIGQDIPEDIQQETRKQVRRRMERAARDA